MTDPSHIPIAVRHRWLPGVAFAVLWAMLAIATTDITFHLAPAIVAGSAALVSRHRRRFWAGFGFGLAALITAALSTTGHLDGPSLLPVGGATLESIVVAAGGSVFGAMAAGRFGSDPHADGATVSASRP
jgi:O-antigen ligase